MFYSFVSDATNWTGLGSHKIKIVAYFVQYYKYETAAAAFCVHIFLKYSYILRGILIQYIYCTRYIYVRLHETTVQYSIPEHV